MEKLLADIRRCVICQSQLPFGPRPIVAAHEESRIVVIGQAPGSKVHASRIPWDDKSGENLRTWMGISEKTFYDSQQIAIAPMGFCYPGKGKSGDLPPRSECAVEWHAKLLSKMPNVKLTLLIGKYAQDYYLKNKLPLTERVQNYKTYLPNFFVLPHPSPRNNIWMKRNAWFNLMVLPDLKKSVSHALA